MNEDAVVVECIFKLPPYRTPIAGIVSGSAAYSPDQALDLDLCVVVEEDVLERAVLKIGGISVDLFVCGATRTEREMKQGLQVHLLRLFAVSRHVFGSLSVSNQLVAVALDVLAGDARPLPPAAAFTVRGRPHNLLRKFADLRDTDRIAALLVANQLIQASVHAFFALRQIWPDGIRHTMQTIRSRDVTSAKSLERALNSDVTALCSDATILETLVQNLVGEDNDVDEIWIVRESIGPSTLPEGNKD